MVLVLELRVPMQTKYLDRAESDRGRRWITDHCRVNVTIAELEKFEHMETQDLQHKVETCFPKWR